MLVWWAGGGGGGGGGPGPPRGGDARGGRWRLRCHGARNCVAAIPSPVRGFRAEESGVKEREKASRWRGRVAWGAAAGLLAMGVCVPVAGAGYVFDLAANLSAQGLGLGVVVCGWFLVGRNWRCAAVGGLGCVLMAWPLVGRVWWVEGPGPARPVRVLVFNSSTTAGDAGEAMGLIERSEADVVVMTEPSGAKTSAPLPELDQIRPCVSQRMPSGPPFSITAKTLPLLTVPSFATSKTRM